MDFPKLVNWSWHKHGKKRVLLNEGCVSCRLELSLRQPFVMEPSGQVSGRRNLLNS